MAAGSTRRQFLGSTAAFAAWSLAGSRPGSQESPVPQAGPSVARFENLAYGMLVHWGLASMRGSGADVFVRSGSALQDFLASLTDFSARDFSGRELARNARRAGMGYAVLTVRTHDGFHLFDTRGLSPHDVTHTPAGRDLVADFVGGCRAENVLPMLYVSLLAGADGRVESDWSGHLASVRKAVEILASAYGPIGGFWFDGVWSQPDADWQLDALYGLVRRLQPEALILENSGAGRGGHVGHPEVDSLTYQGESPRALDRRGHPRYLALETSLGLNAHRGHAPRDFAHLSPADVIETLCDVRRAGSNLLVAVAPDGEGALSAYERATLERTGEWLTLGGGLGGPVYRGRPCGLMGMQRDFGLAQGSDHYLFAFDLAPPPFGRPQTPTRGPGERIWQGLSRPVRRVSWLDSGEELRFSQDGPRLSVQATGFPYGTDTVVRIARVEG